MLFFVSVTFIDGTNMVTNAWMTCKFTQISAILAKSPHFLNFMWKLILSWWMVEQVVVVCMQVRGTDHFILNLKILARLQHSCL